MSPVLVHLGAQFTCQCIGLSMVSMSGDVLAVSEGTSEGRHTGLQDGRHTFCSNPKPNWKREASSQSI